MGFLNKRKITKSFTYYIGEIFIVTIGIFVAIQLNNLNENIKNSKEGKVSLRRIHSDLQVEKYLIESYKTQLSKSTRYLKEVLYNDDCKDFDSILYHTTHYFHPYRMNAEYVNLKSSGKLHLISNDTLRYALVNYYEGYYAIYNEISERQKKFVYDWVMTYYQAEFPSDTTSLINSEFVKLKLEDTKFKNIVIDQFVNYRSTNSQLETITIDRINEMIENEVQ